MKPIVHNPITVILPNHATISSVSTTSSSLNDYTYPVNVFKNDHLHHSLESVATFTNDIDGSVTLDKFDATIRDSKGAVINHTPKLPADRIWTFDRYAPLPFYSAAAVIRHDLHADFVAYAYASFNSPPNSTFVHALKSDYFRAYPNLNYDMFQRNQPQSVATAKGHLNENRKKDRSMKPRATITPLAPPAKPIDSNDVDDNASLILVIPMKTNNTNYTDLMGKFPVESLMRNNYVMLSFYRGYVHTELMKDRSSASLVAAYAATFEYYR